MKLTLGSEPAKRAGSVPRRSRRQHLSNLLLILLAGATVFNFRSFMFGTDRAVEGYTDFSEFYAGAMLVREGRGRELYSYAAQEQMQKRLYAAADSRTGPLLYYHAPFEILVFVPLTWLSYSGAYFSWVAINLTMLGVIALLLLPYLGNLRPVFVVNIFLSFLAFFPIFIAIYHGQDSILLLLLFAAAFINLKQRRFALAGFLLGLGLFRFHIVVPLMLLFVIRKQWKVILGFSAAAVFASVVSILVTGWTGIVKYVELLWESNQNLGDGAHQIRFALYPRAMVNLRGLIYSAFPGGISDRLITIVSLSFSALVLVWFYVRLKKRSNEPADIDIEYSFGIVVVLLVGFYLHLYDWCLLMLPILLVSNHFATLSRPQGRALWTLRLTTLILLMVPVYIALIAFEFISILIMPLGLLAGLISLELAKPYSVGKVNGRLAVN